ncbi:unnamed protein product [Linum tenue]|uniref:Methyltransferase n=1 Tax=Linum tenue TaxID=586396 RepID=A0AAV0I792_9ROSI|nr:unnamed protein product [Linum tenue]
MLTSTSVAPPQTANLTSKAATTLVSTESDAAATTNVVDQSGSASRTTNGKKKQSVFEDNPGDLPADAIKTDQADGGKGADTDQDKDNKHTQISEESTMTTAQSANQQVISDETMTQQNTKAADKPNMEERQQTEEKVVEEEEPQNKAAAAEEANNNNQGNNIVQGNPSLEARVFEEQQQQQRMEDAGVQNPAEEKPENKAGESESQKERRKEDETKGQDSELPKDTWQLCNVTAGPDYIPCLDNEKALKKLRTTGHFEHRERHCPEEPPTCLVPLPDGYKRPIPWPTSRDKIWYHNVPHTKLAEFKGHQNWVKVTGEFLTFPGGGTQFIHGALHYIDFLQRAVPKIGWGKHTRVILDVGCGVASFGGYMFERDVLTMSFAPKDEHEAQVQFALERGIPAISAVMGSKRLPFPSAVFDLIHCARCRVPWHNEGGLLLLELNRLLRPGGYFVWSATPVYQKLKDDVEIWQAMSALTVSMCWDLVTIKRDKLNKIGAAIYRKPSTNDCYDQRKKNFPPMCPNDDDPNAAWSVPLQACMHRVPSEPSIRGSRWPDDWPRRLQKPPYWLNSTQMGIYGKPAPQDFTADYHHWKNVVTVTYIKGLGINWDGVRNVMDMRAVYGGFAAALKDMKVWVVNVVNVDSPDTLPIIFERGLFGIYHDWCESYSTYPRTYDLLHADHLLSKLKTRCKLVPVLAEVDRMLRPGGTFIVRDESSTVGEVEGILKSMHWEVHLTNNNDKQGILSAQKGDWRPETFALSSS